MISTKYLSRCFLIVVALQLATIEHGVVVVDAFQFHGIPPSSSTAITRRRRIPPTTITTRLFAAVPTSNRNHHHHHHEDIVKLHLYDESIIEAPATDVVVDVPKAVADENSTASSLDGVELLIVDGTSTGSVTTTSISSSSTTSNEYPPTPTYLECLNFALPALGIYICSPLMSLIDASFIGRLSSSVELAALGPASSISDSAPLPLLFLSIGATNLIAKSYANKDHEATTQISRTSILMGTIFSIFLGIAVYTLATPISTLYCGGGAQLLIPFCSKYVAIRALALPAVVITTIAQAICIGTKDTKTPMLSVGVAAIFNLLGDYILVKGPLQMGIAGAAYATSISQYIAAILLLRILKQRKFLSLPTLPTTSSNNGSTNDDDNTTTTTTTTMSATVKQLLSFIPFLFVMMIKMAWHNSCSATAASLGGVKAAAHTALLSVAMVCMVLGDVGSSLSQAFLPPFVKSTTSTTTTTSTTKESVSSSFDLDAAMPTMKQLLKCTLSISTTVMLLAAIIIGGFGSQITNDPAVLVEMKRTLPWIVATLSFHGSAVTLEGLLLSQKKFPILTVCYGILGITVAAFQIATRKFNLGLAGVWGCYLWFCSSRVITFSTLGGLLRPRRWFQKIRNNIMTTKKWREAKAVQQNA